MKKGILVIAAVFLTTVGSIIAKELMKSDNDVRLQASRKVFVSGCVAQGASEARCECAHSKLIEKYGLAGYTKLVNQMNSSNTTDITSTPELSSLTSYMTNEIPKLCSE